MAKTKYKRWVKSGKVLFGNVHDDMLQARKAYKKEICKAKKLKKIKRCAHVESVLDCNERNFGKSETDLFVSTSLVLMMLNWVMIYCIVLKVSV